MKFFLAIVLAGFLTGLAIARPVEQEENLSADRIRDCLKEADTAVAEYKPSELLSEVANEALEKLDTYDSMEEIGDRVIELIGGPLASDRGRLLMRDCYKLDALVRPTLYQGSCGPDFGWEIDIHGENRALYLDSHEQLATLIAYRGVCESLVHRDDAPTQIDLGL